MDTIKKVQYEVGGMVVFLEAADNEKLKTFYDRENGYKEFKMRQIKDRRGETHQLIQMLKVI